MARTWGSIRDEIRSGILKDENGAKWNENAMIALWSWAVDQFAKHTADLRVDEFTSDTPNPLDPPNNYDLSEGTAYQLSAEPFDSDNMVVFWEDSDGERTVLDRVPRLSAENEGYYLVDDVVYLRAAPGSTAVKLVVAYYSYWPRPDALPDTDDPNYAADLAAAEAFVIRVPQWAIGALSYLVGAHALAAASVSVARIRNFNTKADSGNPEDNSTREQQNHMLNVYERRIAENPPQDRKASLL